MRLGVIILFYGLVSKSGMTAHKKDTVETKDFENICRNTTICECFDQLGKGGGAHQLIPWEVRGAIVL